MQSAPGGLPEVHGDEGYPFRTRILALAFLGVMWCSFNFPIFAGKVKFPADLAQPVAAADPGEPPSNPIDADSYFASYPWHEYLGERLRTGHVPLWDPHRFIGVPYASNPSMGSWYPPNWLYSTGQTLWVHTVIGSLSMLASLLFTYWFLSLLKLHPYAAAVGAVTFTYSGFLINWGGLDTFVGATIWLPLGLGGVELVRQGRRRRGILLTGTALGLSVLGGHSQIAMYVWIAVALWAAITTAASALQARGSGGQAVVRTVLSGTWTSAAAFVIGAGLSSIQILGALEFAPFITRQAESYQSLLESALPPVHLATLLIPDYLGTWIDGNYSGTAVAHAQSALYAGTLTLPLAFIGVFCSRSRAAVYFTLLGAIGTLAAFGTPLVRILHLGVPLLTRTGGIARISFLIEVALAGLAALGLHELLRRPQVVRQGVILMPTAIIALSLIGLTINRPRTPLPAEYLTSRGIRQLVFLALGSTLLVLLRNVRGPTKAPQWPALALLLLIGADFWIFGFRHHPWQGPRPIYPVTAEIRALARDDGLRPRFVQSEGWFLPNNASLQYRLYSLHGYDPFIPAQFVELISLADEDEIYWARRNLIWPLRSSALQSPILDLLGVSRVIAPINGEARSPAGDVPSKILERSSAFQPAYVAPCWQLLPDHAVLDRLKAMSSDELRSRALVLDSPTSRRLLGVSPQSCGPTATPTIETYEAERVVIRASTTLPAVLVLTDLWFPGWEANVDGERADVLRVNHALRGVPLPPGARRVELIFRPKWFKQGLILTLVTAVFMIALAAILHPRRHARGQAVDGSE